MIREELLRAAAAEVSDAMANELAPSDHTFSAEFEKEMDVLIRRTRRAARRPVLRYIAAVLIALLTALGSMYLLSPSVRAAVNGWIRSTFGVYYRYHTDDVTPPDVEYDYYLPESFDGYTLFTTIDRGSGKFFVYTNSDGQMLHFEYIVGGTNTELFLNVEDCILETVPLGKTHAEVYLSQIPDENSAIVWKDQNESVLFCILAIAEKDELISFADKVEKNSKN